MTRKQARLSDAIYRALVEGSPVAHIVINKDHEIVLANAQAEKMFGFSHDELHGRPIEMLLPKGIPLGHPASRDGDLNDSNPRVMGEGHGLSGSRKDGSEFPVEIGQNSIRTSDGEFVLAAVADITERKRGDEKFHAVVEAAPTAMIMINEAGDMVLANAKVETMFGYRREELLGKKVDMLVPDSARPGHPKLRDRFFTDPCPRQMGAGRDLHGQRKDGKLIPVEIGLNPMQTIAGRFAIAAIVDISERKRGEQERDELMGQLRTLNAGLEERVKARTAELTTTLKEREVLLQEIHHRVKNNLQVISSLINIQTRKLERGASRDALAECQSRVQAIALIHEKLYQSRDYTHVPFAQYARSLARNVFHAVEASQSAVLLEVEIANNVSLAMDTAIACGLIVNELITNALKHAFPGGRRGLIRLEMEKSAEGRVRMVVTDNGVGLPADLDVRQSQSLGLQLVTTLADQLHAQLEVRRQQPGATFQLTFQG